MRHTTALVTLLSAAQREWPILRRLSLIIRSNPPAWVVASVHNLCGRLSAAERARCQADSPMTIARLFGLRRQWWGTLVLAVLLTMAVVARTFEVPLDAQRMVVFAVTLYAILFPALLIYIGITYDYMAALALRQALRSTTASHSPAEQASAGLATDETFAISPAPGAQLQPKYVEQEIEHPD